MGVGGIFYYVLVHRHPCGHPSPGEVCEPGRCYRFSPRRDPTGASGCWSSPAAPAFDPAGCHISHCSRDMLIRVRLLPYDTKITHGIYSSQFHLRKNKYGIGTLRTDAMAEFRPTNMAPPPLSIRLDQRGKTDEIQVRYNNSDKYLRCQKTGRWKIVYSV